MSEDPSDITGVAGGAEPAEHEKRPGERLAKVIARAGLASRRDVESWIASGRVKVNGETVTSAAVNVEPSDRVEVDGKPLPARERTRLWLYHKPRGYVTTTHDPEGRETVFSVLPDSLPRVMTIGRLDINTEGLLLLTNDGGLARVLELPETGWLRRYRVRAFGRTTPEALAGLKDGLTIDGFAYGAIEAEIERQQNDNVWLRFGLREGKNREVKRVAEHLGLSVNRLIRISFGPFQLGALAEGGVEEVRTRTLKEQLGKRLAEDAGCDFEGPAANLGEEAPRMTGGRGAGRAERPAERNRLADPSQRVGRRAAIARPRDVAAPAAPATEPGERPTKTKRAAPIADRKGRAVKVERVSRDKAEAPAKRVHRREEGAAERFGAAGRPARPPRGGANRSDAEKRRSPGPKRREGEEAGGRSYAPREPREAREVGRSERPAGDRPRSDPRRTASPRPRAEFSRRDDGASGGPRAERPFKSDGPRSRGGDARPQRERPSTDAASGRPSKPGRKPFAHGPEGRPPRPAGGPGDRGPGGGKPRAGSTGFGKPRGEGTGAATRGPGGGDRPRAHPGGGKPRGPGGAGKPRGPGGPGKPRGPGGGGGRPGGADRRR